MKKRSIITGIIMVLLLISIAKIDVKAASVVAKRTVGDVSWTLYSDGLLDIKGKGSIGTADEYDDNYDFGLDKYKDKIKSIKIGNGITELKGYFDLLGSSGFGKGVFSECHNLTSVSLPGTLTAIGPSAFLNCYNLKKISIPKGVKSIGAGAFYQCYDLTGVSLPDGLTSVGACAFYYCKDLTDITLPSSVKSIGESAFYYCCSLTNITLPKGITSIRDFTFYYCYNLSNITIPTSVKSIGWRAFSNCNSFTKINIPSGVTTLGNCAFSNCYYLKEVSISNKLLDTIMNDSDYSLSSNPFIGTPWFLNKKGSFNEKSNDGDYSLDKSGTLTLATEDGWFSGLPDELWYYRKSVKTIKIPKNTKKLDLVPIETWTDYFYNVEKIINESSATIALESEYYYSWCNANDLTEPIYSIGKGTAVKVNQKLPKHYKITFDGNGATSGKMTSIKAEAGQSITLPKSSFDKKNKKVTKWKYTKGNKSYTVKNGGTLLITEDEIKKYNISTIKLVAQWETDANYGKVKSKGTTVEDSASKAKYKVVSASKSNPTVKFLKSTDADATVINIPDSITISGVTYKVTEVAQSALKNNKTVTKIKLGKNITKIGNEACLGCIALSTVTLNSNLKTIGNKAFYGCISLGSLTLPAKTSTLGSQFAGNCKYLETLTIKSKKMTSKTLNAKAFKDLSKLTDIKVPNGKSKEYESLFQSKGLSKKNDVK